MYLTSRAGFLYILVFKKNIEFSKSSDPSPNLTLGNMTSPQTLLATAVGMSSMKKSVLFLYVSFFMVVK